MKAIGKYQIIDEIGTGAAGTTYRVRDTTGERELALKVLYSSPIASPETKDQFCRNLASYAELRHPHIAKVLDVGEADGALYVATELLNGIDLRRHFEERRVLPLEEKLEFIAEIADALTVPHSKGIAHGNLKPGNIFIVAGKNAKILDFGSGKWLEVILATGVKPAALLTNYLAPEQILGEPFDSRSDLFSVALILYELLTGKYPFQVAPNLIPREIVHSEPEPLRKLDPQIPEELERLVARALNKNRDERLRSAAEFAAGLNNIAQKVRDSRTASAPVPAVAAPVATPAAESKPSPTMVVPAPKPPAVVPAAPPPSQAAASTPLPAAPVAAATVTIPPPPPVPPQPQPAVAKPALAAIKTAAQESKKKLIPAANVGLLRKRMIPIAIAAVLALVVFGTLLSRQNSQASQHNNETPAIQPNTVAPSTPAPTTPVSVPIQPADAAPPQTIPQTSAVSPVVEVKPAPELILRGQVKSLWEAGKYTQADKLVDVILNEHPSHAEARAWRKKIRAAQEAEAAIK